MNLSLRQMRLVVLSVFGLAALLLMSACAGVASQSNSSITGANGVKKSSGGSGSSNTYVPGSVEFTGQVQSISATSVTVTMPDGTSTFTATINATTQGDEDAAPNVSNGQTVKISATANQDGSFVATSLKVATSPDQQDLSEVKYTGATTSTIGSDNVLHFQVGLTTFGFQISTTATYEDFANAAAIPNNQVIKVTVQFQQGSGTVTKISSASSSD
jgi:hypothetical protein